MICTGRAVASAEAGALTALRDASHGADAADETVDLLTLAELTLEAVFNAAVTLHQAGRLEQASEGYRRTLAAAPHHPASMSYLGMAMAQSQKYSRAIDLLRRASALSPDDAAVCNNLGNALSAVGRREAAITAYRCAIVLAPPFCAPHFNSAVLEAEAGQRITGLERAVICEPTYVPALITLVSINDRLGRGATAARWARRATVLVPREAPVLLAASDHALSAGDPNRAAWLARRTLATGSDLAAALFRLGTATERLDDLDAAWRCYRRSIALDPAFAASHVTLGSLDLAFGRPSNAVTAYRRASASGAATAVADGNLLFALTFIAHDDPQVVIRENRRWARTHSLFGRLLPLPIRRAGSHRLRIGYVSPEFVKHGFLRQLFPTLDHHDRSRIEVFAYSQARAADRWSVEVRDRVDHWRDISRLAIDDQAVAIRTDGIDILVHVTGYLALQRELFTRRMAPAQVAYINHVSTTGLPTIDGRITDAWLEPEGSAFLDAEERLLRLPSGFATYAPPDAPPVEPLPASRNGFVTFGVFNNIAKASDAALAAWARVLIRVPASRLLIKGYGLSATQARARIMAALDRHGIDAHRIELVGRIDDDLANLATVGRADVALDPFPFNGGLSTVETLWMGVPVVSLSGESFVHRLGLTFIGRAGLPALVASTVDEYVDRAVAVASDLDALAVLRRDMRERLRHSMLFDAARHTRELESAYEALLA
jgi:protein O-GlcNAc transferase